MFLESSACSVCSTQPAMTDGSSCECAVDVSATMKYRKGSRVLSGFGCEVIQPTSCARRGLS